MLISSGEIGLTQTATTNVKNPNDSMSEHTTLVLDSGTQRTYITEHLADKLNLKGDNEQEIKLVTFGSDKPKTIRKKKLCAFN